ncbi:recombinase family protein [Eubacterium ventriosum]|uniref:recombinase family protein n=1 Tax=Eubacterium ventriosum TaxID=39496 RepID=UPI002079EAAE|nr:recombinase family protein [Eubacterium ventriosum]
MKRKVAIYARVSTEHEAQINALENQIQYYDNILEQHPEWELVGRYVDEGITGTSVKKRKNFLRMMEDAKNGMFSLILTREVSRFARNTVDTLQETRKLKSYGVEVYFTEDNIRTSDDTDGELRLTLMATLAQNESKKTSVRVKAGQKISFENGVLYGNGNILGYDRVGRELVVNPEQAETVKMIFNMYHDGMGCKQIAYELEKRGRVTSTGLTHWQPGTISRLLRNSFYCGKIVYRKQYVPDYLEQKKINNYDEVDKIEITGKHEPIISEELFNDCQRRLDAKTVNRLRGKHAINPPKSAYARILKCQCGSNFERRKWHKYKDGRIRYGFECYKQKNHGSYRTRLKKGLDTTGCCTTKMFPEWKLKIVAHWLFNDLWKERDKIINRAIEMLNATIKDENVVDYTDEVKELNKKRKKYEEKLSNLVELRVEGDISKEVYEEKKGVFKKQIEYIDSELLKRDVKNSAIVSNVKTQIQLLTDLLEKKYDVISGDIPEDIVETFIDQIVVHDDYFEWRLRTSTEPVLCKVEGNAKDNTIIFLENDSHKVATQYRQLLQIRQNNLIHAIDPIELGNFVITKDYLAKYKETDGNMKKVNKWNDIKIKVTI